MLQGGGGNRWTSRLGGSPGGFGSSPGFRCPNARLRPGAVNGPGEIRRVTRRDNSSGTPSGRAVRRADLLRLEFELRDGRTAPSSAANGVAEGQVTNPAGGILGGDLRTHVSLGAGSSASIVTQGASKAYRRRVSAQHSTFEVGEGAMLEYLPHHVIPCAGSSFWQTTESRLAKGCAPRLGRLRLPAVRYPGLQVPPEVVDGFDPPGDLAGEPEPFGGVRYLAAVCVLAPIGLRGIGRARRGS